MFKYRFFYSLNKNVVIKLMLEDYMSTFKKFEDIEAWKKSRILTKEIYNVTKQRVFYKDIGLREQIRRASVSIMANIAEGFERSGNKEFIQFLSISKGSSAEVRSHLYVALDQEYITQEIFNNLYQMSDEICKMINGLVSYLKSSSKKGRKYQ
jgi:four helix bundle protein